MNQFRIERSKNQQDDMMNYFRYSMNPFPDLRHRVGKRSHFRSLLIEFDLLICCSNVKVIPVEQALLKSCSS